MNKTLLSALIVAGAAMGAQFAHASDGTVNFVGKVNDQTCTPTAASKDLTVTLPTVSKSSLVNPGDTTGVTPFTINLTGCNAAAGNVRAYFEPGPTVNMADGNLTNTKVAGGATNVEIALLNPTASLTGTTRNILVNADATAQVSAYQPIQADGTAALPYAAQYYATGVSTPGDVTSSVTYSISYN